MVLDSDDGPTVRYGSYLAALRGLVPLVIGTRHAAWQPCPRWRPSRSGMRRRPPWPGRGAVPSRPHRGRHEGRVNPGVRSSWRDTRCQLRRSPWPTMAAGGSTTGTRGRRLPASAVVGDERREREGAAAKRWMPAAVWSELGEGNAGRRGCHRGASSGTPVLPAHGAGHGRSARSAGDLSRSAATAVPECTDCGIAAPAWRAPSVASTGRAL